MATEDIGGVSIGVTADFSDLDAQFEAAVQRAVAEGQTLAEAIQSAMKAPDASGVIDAFEQAGAAALEAASQLNLFDEAANIDYSDAAGQLNLFATELEPIGQAATGAADAIVPLGEGIDAVGSAAGAAEAPLEGFGAATAGASESAHEAEGGFAGMAEQLLIFGEALAVTEGLTEFGHEAINAADSVTTATIALTALTGKAAQTTETIEKLRVLGDTDNLKFPALLTAATRMQAFLGASADVPAILKHVADAAAVVHTSVDDAANAFDRLASSGQANARSLLALGITIADLAKALGTTEEAASKAFMALDKAGRIEALSTALQKYDGVAKDIAEHTLSLNTVMNKWDEVLEVIGKSLEPVVLQAQNFVTSGLLPFIKSVAEDFGKLPTPVKDFAIALGLAVAAIAPLAVGVAGIGLALSGVSAALPVIEALSAAISSFALETIPAAIEAVGTFAFTTLPAAVTEMAAFSTALVADAIAAITTFATVAIPAAIEAIGVLIFTTIPAAIAGFGALAGEAVASAGASLISFATNAVAVVVEAITSMATAAIPLAIGALSALGAAVSLAAAAFVGFKIGEWLYNNVGAFKSFGDAIADNINKFHEWALQSRLVNDAMAAMGDATAKANQAILAEVGIAEKLNAALIAHGVTIERGNLSLDSWIEKMSDAATHLGQVADAGGKFSSSLTAGQAATEASAISMQKLRDNVDATQQKLVAAVAAYDQAKAAGLDLAKATDAVVKAQQDALAAEKALTSATQTHVEKITVLAKATHDFVDISKAAAAGMLDFQTATDKAWSKVGLLIASQEHLNELLAVQKARFDAGQISAAEYQKTLDAAKKVNDELAKSLDAVNKIAKEIADAAWKKQIKDGIDAATTSLKDFLDQAVRAPQPISDVNKAMIDAGIGAGKLKTAIEDLKTPIAQLVTGMQALVAEAQRSGDWSKVIQDLDNFDKRIQNLAKTDLPEAAHQMEVWIQGMINAGAPTELVQGQLIKLEAIIDKMGKEGLPQAVTAMKGYLDLLKQVPSAVNDIISKQENQIQNDQKSLGLLMQRKDAIGAVLEAQKQLYTDEIRLGELQGKNVEAEIYGLEKTKLGLESNRIATHGLADEYVKMIEIVNKGFDAIGKSIADCIIDQKNFGEAMIATLKNIAKEILETVIEGALLPLKKALIDLEKKWLDSIDITKKGVDDLSKSADEAAKAQKGLGSAATAAAQAVSQLASTISIITGIISAGAAVASTIILSHISSDTGHIEVNTRGQLAEALNLRADLWQQHNTLYDRLGECKNDLDSIVASIKILSQAPPAVVAANTQSALEKIASTGDLQLAQQASIADSAKWSLAALNLIAGSTAKIADALDYTIHDDLAGVNHRLDLVIGAILYGNTTSRQASQDIVHEMATMSAMSTQAAHGIIGAISADVAENARGTDVEIAALEAARQAAAKQYASATSLQAQVAALQAQIAADNQLAAALTRSGNANLAQTYINEANMLGQDVRSLIPQIGTVVSSLDNIANLTVAQDLNYGAYVTNSTTQIVGAVYGAASIIANAVGVAIANAGAYPTGGGTTTTIPPKGTQTNVPSAESQNPGNSNSPTGNTGLPVTTGPGGVYSIPKTQTTYSTSPPSTDMHNADGTPFIGNYVPQKVNFDPLNPFTWSSNMTQAQQDAINNSHPNSIPSYDQGGMVPQDMLSLVHKDEMVLPPDLSQMLKRMASTPSTPGSYPTYAGSQGVSAGGGETKIYLPVTFNGVTSARELLSIWTQQVKRTIPRATVFSS